MSRDDVGWRRTEAVRCGVETRASAVARCRAWHMSRSVEDRGAWACAHVTVSGCDSISLLSSQVTTDARDLAAPAPRGRQRGTRRKGQG
eukprot:590961-Prymnesium_polylepis.1